MAEEGVLFSDVAAAKGVFFGADLVMGTAGTGTALAKLGAGAKLASLFGVAKAKGPVAAESGALRSRVLANIADSQAARARSNFGTYATREAGILAAETTADVVAIPKGSANPVTRAAASRGSTLHSDKPGMLPDQLRAQYPSTTVEFTKPGVAGQDVKVVGGDHPSTYGTSSWPKDVNYGDFKPGTDGGAKTFKYDQKYKWDDPTHYLPYDPVTGKLKPH